MTILKTRRLEGHAITIDDAKVIQEFETRNHVFFSMGEGTLPKDWTEYCNVREQSWKEGKSVPFLFLDQTGQLVAMVTLNEIIRGAFQSCFIGWKVDQAHARQGYGREAVDATTKYAFQSLSLHRIEANIIEENKASIALARSCGFHYEGTARNYLFIDGEWRDHQHWVLLHQDTKPHPSR